MNPNDKFLDDRKDEDRKEDGRELPEMKESEVNEVDWSGVPRDIEGIIRVAGASPNSVLEWGIKNARKDVVEWSLESGGNINELGKIMLMNLGRDFPIDFVKDVITNYVTSKRVKEIIYSGVIESGIIEKDKDKIIMALESGGYIEEVRYNYLYELYTNFPLDFIEKIVRNYAKNNKTRQRLLRELLMRKMHMGKVDINLEGSGIINFVQK